MGTRDRRHVLSFCSCRDILSSRQLSCILGLSIKGLTKGKGELEISFINDASQVLCKRVKFQRVGSGEDIHCDDRLLLWARHSVLMDAWSSNSWICFLVTSIRNQRKCTWILWNTVDSIVIPFIRLTWRSRIFSTNQTWRLKACRFLILTAALAADWRNC